ncbi:MAG TPA: GDSL-type esterase/lipase family protein, partial [Isosphaeraceae bacterium]
MIRLCWFVPLILWVALTHTGRAEFALRDDDTVVFLGDSITAARTYGKIVENYNLLRFPDRAVRFVNAGTGGDTAAGGLQRLERDVFARNATVLIVAYGINDIGWGLAADEDHKRIDLDAVRGIIERCRARAIRVFLCSAAVTAEDPETAETGFLQRLGDEALALARSLGAGAIDVQRPMRTIQRRVLDANARVRQEKDKASLHAADGVHLSDLGQLAMALAILKGLGAPANVSAVTRDARGPVLVEATGCRVTGLVGDATRLEFDRRDEGLPINFGVLGALQFRYVPIPEEPDRYLLAVRDLPAGHYRIEADGRALGRFSSGQLASGVNLGSATAGPWQPGGPWDAQADILIQATEARDRIDVARATAGRNLPQHPARETLEEQARAIDAPIWDLQRTLARPRPFHFVITPDVGRSAERGREAVHQPLNPPLWLARAYDDAWRQWGIAEKPAEYERAFRERYGLHPAPYDNGGLPMGFHRAPGRLSLGIGNDCLLCHA